MLLWIDFQWLLILRVSKRVLTAGRRTTRAPGLRESLHYGSCISGTRRRPCLAPRRPHVALGSERLWSTQIRRGCSAGGKDDMGNAHSALVCFGWDWRHGLRTVQISILFYFIFLWHPLITWRMFTKTYTSKSSLWMIKRHILSTVRQTFSLCCRGSLVRFRQDAGTPIKSRHVKKKSKHIKLFPASSYTRRCWTVAV